MRTAETEDSPESVGESSTRVLLGGSSGFVRGVALLFALFQLGTAAFGSWPNLIHRNIHVAFALVLCFALYPLSRRGGSRGRIPFYDWAIIASSAASAVYMYSQYDRIIMAMSQSTSLDLVFGAFLLLALLEGARRTIGWLFPCIALSTILYAYFGPYFPGMWKHSGFSLTYILENLYMTTNGLWGTIVGISATVLASFVIFAALLVLSGGGEAFIRVALLMAGRTYGGAAKVATIASALFGTISGSPVANVVTTGSFTIPMMKRLGYGKEFAAAVEATASTGGQLAPPIMGAGAFLMAEYLGIPYLSIAAAAVIPAWLYFFGCGASVHLEAKRVGLSPVEPDRMPRLREVFRADSVLSVALPIGTLLLFMLSGFTPATSVFWATAATISLYMVTGHLAKLRTRMQGILNALVSGAKGIVQVAVLIGCAQITVSMIGLTGVGVKVSELILGLSGGQIVLALVLAMVVCMVLGMGVPTTAAYVLAAAVVAPALVAMGIAPLSSHMFLFYYAVLGAITPPVCVAVFVASGLAQSDWLKTGWIAVRLGLAGFIAPFMFIFSPSLLMVGSPVDIVLAAITATLGVYILGGATMGYLSGKRNLAERLVLLVSAVLLIEPSWKTSLIGVVLFASVLLRAYWKKRGAQARLSQAG